jgi:hypothetical protein
MDTIHVVIRNRGVVAVVIMLLLLRHDKDNTEKVEKISKVPKIVRAVKVAVSRALPATKLPRMAPVM